MKTLSFSLLAAAIASGVAAAATAYTTPVGYTTEVLKGKVNPGDPEVFNLMGITLHETTLVAGDLEAVGASSVSDTDVDLTTVLGSGTYVLEITSGTGAGIIQDFTTFTTTDVTGIQSLAPLGVAANDTYRIRKAATVEDIFGSAATSSLSSGTQSTADIVWVSTGGNFKRYYIAAPVPPFQPNPTWTLIGGGSASPATDPIVYADAVIVQRRSVGNQNLVVTGELKIDKTVQMIASVDSSGPEYEFNYFSSIYPVGFTIEPNPIINSESTVASFGLDTVMVAGDPATTADILWLPNGNGGYRRFYNSPPVPPFKPTQTFDEIGGATAINPATVRMPSGFIFQRRNGNGDLNHTLNVPTAYSSL